MLSIFSYVYRPSLCPPWRSVNSGPLPIFNWIIWGGWCWVVEVLHRFWILAPYQLYPWWTCSPIQWVVFSSCWWSSLLCKNFLVWCSPIIYLFFCFFCPRKYIRKILLPEMSEILLPMFSSRIFMVSSLTLKTLIHFEFILVYRVRRWSSFLFYTYLSNSPKSIYWIDCFYPIVCSCLLCQILIDRTGVGLFLGSLFCSTDLYIWFHVSTMLFCLQWPSSCHFHDGHSNKCEVISHCGFDLHAHND